MTTSGEFSQTSGTPDFMVLFDGTQPDVSESERRIVAQKFTSLYQDLLLNYASEVNSQSAWRPGCVEWLHLEVPEDTGSHWEGDLLTPAPPVDEMSNPAGYVQKRLIDIKHVVQGEVRNQYSYILTADDVVRRYDSGDVYAGKVLQEALGEDLSSLLEADKNKTLEEVEAGFRDPVGYAIEKERAEEDARRNNQPVGLTEIEGLAGMLTGPGVTAGYPSERYQFKTIIY